jgi:hypothetical protein
MLIDDFASTKDQGEDIYIYIYIYIYRTAIKLVHSMNLVFFL